VDVAAKKKQSEKSDIESVVATAIEHIRAAKAALATVDLAKLTADERKFVSGRLREGEPAALKTLLDAIDEHPAVFQSLADRDGGKDPNVLETAPSREALVRRDLLAPLGDELEALSNAVSDDLLVSAALVKGLTVPAYAIAKANASVNTKLRKSISSALDFYSKTGRRKK
jgi:hypothetical protein